MTRQETVDKERPCIVCGTPTFDRVATLHHETQKVRFRDARCSDGAACAERRRTRYSSKEV